MGSPGTFSFRGRTLEFTATPLLMGILNMTPDSFYDGGQNNAAAAGIARGLEMLSEGAAILDIGGESTRPGFRPVSPEEEIARILPVITGLRRKTDVPISVDTSKASVARAALEAGADIINDVTALADPEMLPLLREYRPGFVLMHKDALPADEPSPATAVKNWLLQARKQIADATGLAFSSFLCDPGIGFGKKQPQNIAIIREIEVFSQIPGSGILLAASRKSFLCAAAGGEIAPSERLPGTLAVTLRASSAVAVLRVHDVAETAQALAVARAIRLS